MTTLYIMACSAGKTEKAFQPYIGRQHDLVTDRMWNERFACGDDLAYLSAKHGFISCAAYHETYEKKMTVTRACELTAQGAEALLDLLGEHDRIVVYGGKDYRAVVLALAPDHVEVIELVGKDRGCGDHFSALVYELDGQYDY